MKTAEYKIDHYEVTEYTDDYRIIEGSNLLGRCQSLWFYLSHSRDV